MKVIVVVFACSLALVLANPDHLDRDAQILRYDSDNIGVNGYQYGFETSNGLSQEEQGQVVNEGREDESIAVRGHYSYTAPDGQKYEVQYIADENGFQPQGAHLPH